MKPAAPVTRMFTGSALTEVDVGTAVGGQGRPLGVLLVAGGHDRVGHAPVGADLGVVPGHAQLVGRVVVPVDEVGDGHVGQGREAVGEAGRDVHAAVVVVLAGRAGLRAEVDGEGGPVGGRAHPQVVQH